MNLISLPATLITIITFCGGVSLTIYSSRGGGDAVASVAIFEVTAIIKNRRENLWRSNRICDSHRSCPFQFYICFATDSQRLGSVLGPGWPQTVAADGVNLSPELVCWLKCKQLDMRKVNSLLVLRNCNYSKSQVGWPTVWIWVLVYEEREWTMTAHVNRTD